MSSDYVSAMMARIKASDPELPRAELDKAAAQLSHDTQDQRLFFTDLLGRSPSYGVAWDRAKQAIVVTGMKLKK